MRLETLLLGIILTGVVGVTLAVGMSNYRDQARGGCKAPAPAQTITLRDGQVIAQARTCKGSQ